MINSDGYKAFSVGDGVIIVSSTPEISDSLAANPKWFKLHTLAHADVFASSDLEKEIRCNGLPQNVVKFLKSHSV